MYYTGLCFIGKKDKSAALKMMNDLKPWIRIMPETYRN